MARKVVTKKSRRIRDRILIQCEGETELLLARELKGTLPRELQRGVEIQIDSNGLTDPAGVIVTAIEKIKKAKRERNKFNRVWVFIDHDNHGTLDRARDLLEGWADEVQCAYSAISIEYWYLLHFEDTRRAFDSAEEVIRALKIYWPKYSKTSGGHFTYLKGQYEDAKERAVRYFGELKVTDDIRVNPFTNVYILIDFMLGIGSGK